MVVLSGPGSEGERCQAGGQVGGDSGAGAAGADAGAVDAGEQDSQPTFEELYNFQQILLNVDKLDEDDALILNEYTDIPLKPLIINQYGDDCYVALIPVERGEPVTESKLKELMKKAPRLVRGSGKKQKAKINSLRKLKEAYILYKSHKEAKPDSSGYRDALKDFEASCCSPWRRWWWCWFWCWWFIRFILVFNLLKSIPTKTKILCPLLFFIFYLHKIIIIHLLQTHQNPPSTSTTPQTHQTPYKIVSPQKIYP